MLIIKSFFNPFFLIRISSSSYNIFFPSLDICFNIFALICGISYIIPFFKIIKHDLFLFRSNHNSHIMFAHFISSTSSNSWLCKIHYIECIYLSFLTPSRSKIEPLLVSSCICINLHV